MAIYNGGYFMVNCEGLDLIKGATPQRIIGLYRACKTAMLSGKPIFACGANWDGKYVTPIQTFLIQISDDTIIATSSTLQIVITEGDVVTINNMAPAN